MRKLNTVKMSTYQKRASECNAFQVKVLLGVPSIEHDKLILWKRKKIAHKYKDFFLEKIAAMKEEFYLPNTKSYSKVEISKVFYSGAEIEKQAVGQKRGTSCSVIHQTREL